MLAFYVHDIMMDSKSYHIIEGLNKLNTDCVIYYNNFYICPSKSKHPILPSLYLFNVHYPVISTCLNTTEFLKNNNIPYYFYLYDLEWIHKQHLAKPEIYRDSTLITRNQYQFNIVSKVWKKPLCTIEDSEYEKFQEINQFDQRV